MYEMMVLETVFVRGNLDKSFDDVDDDDDDEMNEIDDNVYDS